MWSGGRACRASVIAKFLAAGVAKLRDIGLMNDAQSNLPRGADTQDTTRPPQFVKGSG